LEIPGKHYNSGIDRQDGPNQKQIMISDEEAFDDADTDHQDDEIFDREFADFQVEEMEEEEK